MAGITRDADEFASDDGAIEWLTDTLDKFTEVFIPYIKEVSSK